MTARHRRRAHAAQAHTGAHHTASPDLLRLQNNSLAVLPRPLSPARPQELRSKADDPAFQARWQAVKDATKARAIDKIQALTGITLPNKNALLDVQVGGREGWPPGGRAGRLEGGLAAWRAGGLVGGAGWGGMRRMKGAADEERHGWQRRGLCSKGSAGQPPAARARPQPPAHPPRTPPQVKRIHEYKRQLLNVLGIIWRYDQIRKMSPEQKREVGARGRRCACPGPAPGLGAGLRRPCCGLCPATLTTLPCRLCCL